jgi:hypothetical protein
MRSDIERNEYHNSGTQRFRAIGIPFVAPSTTVGYRFVRPSLEKVEVRPPATLIFLFPRWLAWGGVIPTTRRYWVGGVHPGWILSIGCRALLTGDMAGPAGARRRGIAARRADDTHWGRGSRAGHLGCWNLRSTGASGEFARCQAFADFCWNRSRGDHFPRARRIFGGCPPVRASRNHHSSAATAHQTIVRQGYFYVPQSSYPHSRQQWY